MPVSGPFPPPSLDRRGAESGPQVGTSCTQHLAPNGCRKHACNHCVVRVTYPAGSFLSDEGIFCRCSGGDTAMENRDIAPRQGSPRFLDGGGEMGERIRAFDWCATPLGKPARWPQALRTLVNLLLASKQPMFLGWGPKRTWLYNDAFI